VLLSAGFPGGDDRSDNLPLHGPDPIPPVIANHMPVFFLTGTVRLPAEPR
jgi:hypothetical protein